MCKWPLKTEVEKTIYLEQVEWKDRGGDIDVIPCNNLCSRAGTESPRQLSKHKKAPEKKGVINIMKRNGFSNGI